VGVEGGELDGRAVRGGGGLGEGEALWLPGRQGVAGTAGLGGASADGVGPLNSVPQH
jgi:hypothetical protein